MRSSERTEELAPESPLALIESALSGESAAAARSGANERTAARNEALYRRVLLVTDLCAGLGAVMLMRLIVGHHALLGWDLLGAVLIPIMAKLLNLYEMDRVTIRRSTLDEVPALVILAAVFAVMWSLLTIPLGDQPGGRGGTGLLWLLLAALLILTRSGVRAVARRVTAPERLLIIGSAQARQAIGHSLSTDPGAHIEVVGYLPLEDERRRDTGPPAHIGAERRTADWGFDDVAVIVSALNVDRVLLAPSAADSDLMLEAVRATTALNVSVSLLPRLFEVVGSAVEFDTVAGVTVLGLRRPGLSRSSQAIKRSVDVAGAAVALTLLSPLFLVLSVAIKLDSRGPVLFRQRRVGRNGEVFEMLKFRSMVDGADAWRPALAHRNETQGLFKLERDPRVTRVGRLIRRCSVDELPQFLNVLNGEMSLVGPRPLVLAEDALIQGRDRERLALTPGMTGPWQVLGPIRPPLSEMVKTDYLYAITWTLWLDIKILLRTLSHIGSGRGR
jgi:exopolysaccharide biosynthesis polyprenyl glycosylphosphotransferase